MGVGRDIGASKEVEMREMVVAGDVGAPGVRGLGTDAGLRRLGVSALRIFLSCSHYPTILSPGSGPVGLQGSESSKAKDERVFHRGSDPKMSSPVGGQPISHYSHYI